MKTAMTVGGRVERRCSAGTLEPHWDASAAAADDLVVVSEIGTRSHHQHRGAGLLASNLQNAGWSAGFVTAVSFMIPAFATLTRAKIREFI
jgi:hypothetical protein